ncbi:sulfatase family protein [Kordiimonas sp.]|uniref:sulfatase family protein n=1 Tax=Kordiimonas sp. TaxID=1970157 RepID=UPI003B517C4F
MRRVLVRIFLPLRILIVLLSTAVVNAGSSVSAAPGLPNIIIINVDDLGYGDVGAYGAEKILTPNIDKLASDGMRFTDAHAASAVCSPSRYALLTGEYPARINFWLPVFAKTPLMVDEAKTTVASMLKESGYSTAIVGKWHLGFGHEEPVDWNKALKPGPLELGFDYYFGVPVLNSHPPFVFVENHYVVGLTEDDPLVYGEKAVTREFDEKFDYNVIGGGEAAHALYEDRKVGTLLTEKAIDWVESHKSEPFFLYFATTNIHHPFTPSPRFIGTSPAGSYGDFVHELDWMIGELLAAVEKAGVTENTLIFFISDNGAMFNRGGQTAWETGHHVNGDLLGMKFGAWEGGHRVPFFAKWPGHIPVGTVSSGLVSNVDFLATLADIVGSKLTPEQGPDSVSFLPILIQEEKGSIRESLIISPASKNHLSIRKGRWMYISGQGEGGFSGKHLGQHDFAGPAALKFTGQVNSDIEDGKVKADAPKAQLYDLDADPEEKVNVIKQYPDVAKELQTLLEKTMQ